MKTENKYIEKLIEHNEKMISAIREELKTLKEKEGEESYSYGRLIGYIGATDTANNQLKRILKKKTIANLIHRE